jgi:hypothetical protein
MLGEAATLVYEASQYDPNATMISPAGGDATIASSAPAAAPQNLTPPSAQTYSGQVPAGPVAPQAQVGIPYPKPVPEKRGNLSWLWAGIGCVVVFLCVLVVGLLIFDTLDLYCTPPFDILDPFYNMIGGSCY